MDDRLLFSLYPQYYDPLYLLEIHADVFSTISSLLAWLEQCFMFYSGWKCAHVHFIEDVFIVENPIDNTRISLQRALIKRRAFHPRCCEAQMEQCNSAWIFMMRVQLLDGFEGINIRKILFHISVPRDQRRRDQVLGFVVDKFIELTQRVAAMADRVLMLPTGMLLKDNFCRKVVTLRLF